MLIEPFPESALNEAAGKLLLENYEEYAKHAKLMTSIHAQTPKRSCPIFTPFRLPFVSDVAGTFADRIISSGNMSSLSLFP